LLTYKKFYLAFVVSTFTLSFIAALVESTAILVESVTVVAALSVLTTVVESVVVVELEEPLQAAKAPMAKIVKSFFIVMYLFVNDLMLIHGLGKSNLPDLIKIQIIFFACRNMLIINVLQNKLHMFLDPARIRRAHFKLF
jgi:hypothetical protein